MQIALVGTRGVPARYGGFETCVEEVGRRLATFGHDVVVYCREPGPSDYLGMRRVEVASIRHRTLETLSSTGLAVADVMRRRPDVVLVFNSANAPLLPALRARRIPVATHVDGLEWRRAKWSGAGQRYYRRAEALAVRWSDALIADAQGIQDYYRDEFGVDSEQIAYGAPILDGVGTDLIGALGLEPGGFHLVVARFEPENHVDLMISGYRLSTAERPLVVVGGVPYGDDYMSRIRAAAGEDSRIRLIGPVWDHALLDQLYTNAYTYLHGHSVGGTNPSLLRALGAGAATFAYDVVFNREVLRDAGRFFTTEGDVAALVEGAEADQEDVARRGQCSRQEAARYDWDEVAKRYEHLCEQLAAGRSQKGQASGRRRRRGVAAGSGPDLTAPALDLPAHVPDPRPSDSTRIREEMNVFNDWIHRPEDFIDEFKNASPFPLLLIDDFLDTATAEALLAEFPAVDAMPKSRDYMFGDKRELSSVAEQGPTSRAFYDALLGPEFKEFICRLTGRPLFVDPAFHGGGFHQSGDGGFLDTHVDFNMHPLHPNWLRVLNILLYLNKDWTPEYDGRLLIKSSPDAEPRGIEPLFNRGLLMLTDDHTYHGFRKMSLPPGVTRKSIATYAYEEVPVGSIESRTTGWAPEEGSAFKKSIAKHYNALVRVKTNILGSRTAKNR